MSQEHLSHVSGLHRTAIGKIELGEVEPRLSTLLVLAEALNASLDQLADGLGVPRERRPSPQARPER